MRFKFNTTTSSRILTKISRNITELCVTSPDTTTSNQKGEHKSQQTNVALNKKRTNLFQIKRLCINVEIYNSQVFLRTKYTGWTEILNLLPCFQDVKKDSTSFCIFACIETYLWSKL